MWTGPKGSGRLTSRTMCQNSMFKTCHSVESFSQVTA